MSAPSVIECDNNTVKLVAENIVTCRIHIKNRSKNYFYTYVDYGDTAPAAPTNLNNPEIDYDGSWIEIDTSVDLQFLESADVYIYCSGGIDGSGYVRIDS